MSAHILFKYHPGDALSLTGTTFTRASEAHYLDAAATMQVAAVDTVRDASYSGADGVRRLLLEASRTNLVPYGEPTLAQLWTKSAHCTETTPLHGLGRLAFATDTTESEYAYQLATLAADAQVVLSVYLDTDTDPAPVLGTTQIEVDIGEAQNVWPRGAYSVVPVAPRFWRIGVSMAATARTNARLAVYRGSLYVQRTFRVAGWQLEVGPAASSYIHTTGTSATRAADVMTTPLPAGVAATRYERYIDQATLTLVERATPYTTPASLTWEVDRAWEAHVIAQGTWSLDAMRVFAQPERAVGATPVALVVTTARATFVPGTTFQRSAALSGGLATLDARAPRVGWTPAGHGWLTGTVSATPTLTGTVSLDSTPTP